MVASVPIEPHLQWVCCTSKDECEEEDNDRQRRTT